MSNLSRDWVVHVTIEPPFGREALCAAINTSGGFLDSFRPLPTGREIFPDERLAAADQIRWRKEKAKHIGKQLGEYFAEAILEAIEKQDTVNGYKRSEL